tara:strand:- start:197 stop:532 length:336 start_codon:yes stop_codon:yes gene_type:complete
MSRLIDTMTEVELRSKVDKLYFGSINNLRGELEKLFAPAPHWSDSLEEEDNQTWVLCFVSDESAKDTRDARWITSKVYKSGSTLKDSTYEPWEYATPIDLDLRYNSGDSNE